MLHRDSNISRRVHNDKPRHRRVVVNQVQIIFLNKNILFSKGILNTFLIPTWRHRLSLQPFRDSHFYIIWYGMEYLERELHLPPAKYIPI